MQYLSFCHLLCQAFSLGGTGGAQQDVATSLLHALTHVVVSLRLRNVCCIPDLLLLTIQTVNYREV